MAHMIMEHDNMVYVGQKPWHGIGKEVKPTLNALDAMCEAGLDWQVAPRNLYLYNSQEEIQGFKAIQRQDTGHVLGVVGSEYKEFQNRDGFEVFQTVLDTGLAQIETAGSLKNGRVVWALAKVLADNEVVTGGDEVAQYVLLSFGHDGTRSIRAGFTPVRVVCQNTLYMSENSASSKLIRVAHRGNVKDNVQALMDTMDLSIKEFRATVSDYRKMLNTPINQQDLREYVRVTLGLVERTDNKKASNIIDKVVSIASTSTPRLDVVGTVWGAYNGITEYLTWHASRSQDNRAHSLWMGNNARVLQRAHEGALKLVA